jgi:CRISPR type III-A-associated RAMP protein Csm5
MNPDRQTRDEVKAIESKVIYLQIQSPVHIGTREGRLLPMEYITQGGRVFVIDEGKFGVFLRERQLIDHFVSAARRPGTSLKGIFRTGVLYGILSEDRIRGQELERKISDQIGFVKGQEYRKKFFSQNMIQEDLLQSFRLPNARPQNQDLLRCLTVRDAYPVYNSVRTQVVKIQFLSKNRDEAFYWSNKKKPSGEDSGSPLEIWLEAVVEGVFQVELIWDRRLFETFRRENSRVEKWPVSGLDDLLTLTVKMSRDLCKHEALFFNGPGVDAGKSLQRWYTQRTGNLFRIGFGSGMLGTTVNLLWSEPVRQKIRNACGHPRGNDPAPKSRRIWQRAEGEWLPMGWLRLVKEPKPRIPEATVPEAEPLKEVHPIAPRPQSKPPAPPLKHPHQVLKESKANFEALREQAKSIRLNDAMQLERLLGRLDDLESADANAVAQLLKERFIQGGVWKDHRFRQEIEMFLEG